MKQSETYGSEFHKVGNVSPKGYLPIGNRNNQHNINSRSAKGCLPYELLIAR
ncbi:MAG: hypothetical protein LBU34_08675 [Planctomycetaceae bacterium]|nr:hypothetical protein [Planctomycetaceae bacterium]